MSSFLASFSRPQLSTLEASGRFSYHDDPWVIDRYPSKHKALRPLAAGGSLYLVSMSGFVTLRAVLVQPRYEDGFWIAPKKNSERTRTINVYALSFARDLGPTTTKAALYRRLRTPQLLTEDDEVSLLGGVRPEAALRRLKVASTLNPKSLAQLDALRRRQLRIAGKDHDGKDLPAEARLARPPHPSAPSDGETSAGYLRIYELADAGGNILYDAFVCSPDSGSAFKSGTTSTVAELVQGGVQCRDPALRAELSNALGRRIG